MMQYNLHIRLLLGLWMVAAGSMSGCKKDENPTSPEEPTQLPLGTIRDVTDITCPDELGDRCIFMRVTCPNIADATLILRVSGSGSRGTVALFSGGLGIFYYASGGEFSEGSEYSRQIMRALLDDGYRLAEVKWNGNGVWEGPEGSLSLACRSATVLRWVYDNLHQGGLFAAQGNSGGNSQIAFSLAYYGAAEILDLANLSSGPPPCPISSGGRLNQSEQNQCMVWRGSWDQSKEPILSGNPRLNYPRTTVRFFVGANEPNPDIIEAANAFHDAIAAKKSLQVVPNAGHDVPNTPKGASALLASIREAGGG